MKGKKKKKNKHPGHELSMASDYMGFCWEVIQDPVTVYASIHVISVISVFIKERTQRRAQIASQPDASANQRDILCAMLESQWKRSGIPKRNATEKHRFAKKKLNKTPITPPSLLERIHHSKLDWLTRTFIRNLDRSITGRLSSLIIGPVYNTLHRNRDGKDTRVFFFFFFRFAKHGRLEKARYDAKMWYKEMKKK